MSISGRKNIKLLFLSCVSAIYFIGCGSATDSSITSDNNESDTFIDSTLAEKPTTPTLTNTPKTIYGDSVEVEVNGQVGNSVWLNGLNKGTIGSDGTLTISLDTSGVDGSKLFTFILKDSSQNSSETLTITINRHTIDRADAIKLLRQASFISKETYIDTIMDDGYVAWVDGQLNTTGDLDSSTDNKYGYLESLLRFLNNYDPTRYPASIITDPYTNLEEAPDSARFKIFSNSIWWEKALENEDQLRQRVAYALSQLLVISRTSSVGNSLHFRGEAVANYYDILVKHSFGNYRDLLKEVTMSSAMPYYLTFIGSKKEDNATGTAPDENYARELMQLFTIGLYELNTDGTKKNDSNGNPIPTYTQQDVSELSKVFTGWDWQTRGTSWRNKYGDTSYYAHSLTVPIQFTSEYHEYGQKSVLGQNIDANLGGEEDIDAAIDILMSNANMAPHVCRHLIMRMVTSNPTPEYVQRVSSVFNDNGEGIKGDLKATIRAILIDPEARGETVVTDFGKVEEFTIATTHFMSTFNVKPYPFINYYTYSTQDIVKQFENTYWFDPTTQFYPQSILNAESVFNFYSPEFVPSDTYFATNNLVSPEMEIRTINSLIGYSKMFFTLFNYERYRVIEFNRYNPSNATTIEAWTENSQPNSGRFRNLYLDLTDVYNYFEMQIDGDTNGDFVNINSTEVGHRMDTSDVGSLAISSLINYLDEKMLGGMMPEDYKTELKTHLLTVTTQIKITKAETIVRTAIRTIATSPLYMVLK